MPAAKRAVRSLESRFGHSSAISTTLALGPVARIDLKSSSLAGAKGVAALVPHAVQLSKTSRSTDKCRG